MSIDTAPIWEPRVLAEFVEEPVKGCGVAALVTPDDFARVVIRHQGAVVVVLPSRDLVGTERHSM
jgi:hypothetical protein